MPPRESGPWPSSRLASLLCAIGSRLIGVNLGHDRHSRQQPLQQRLVLVERNPHRDALDYLGEIAGGVVGWQQRELRSAGGRNPLDPAMQSLAWETIDGHIDRLARFDPRQLSLLVVGDDIDLRQRHDIDQVAPDIAVVTRLHLTLADDAVEWCYDFGVAELEAGRRQRRLGALQIRRTLLLGSGQHLELVALCRDQGPARPNISLRAGVARSGLLQLLPGAGFGLCQ